MMNEKIEMQAFTKHESVSSFLKIIAKELGELVDSYGLEYTIEVEQFKIHYDAKIIVGNSSSAIIKPKDTAMIVNAFVTEELTGVFLRRMRHRLHLKIRVFNDKIPGVNIESIRALFSLYKDKLVNYLRTSDLKDADSDVEFVFT